MGESQTLTQEELNQIWITQIGRVVAFRMHDLFDSYNNKRPPVDEIYKNIFRSLQGCNVHFGLLPDSQWDDKADLIDLIRVYNPATFAWESPRYLLEHCLYSAIGTTRPQQHDALVELIWNSLFQAKNQARVPEPYHGSRYVLFKNGIFDAKHPESLIKLHTNWQKAPIKTKEPILVPIVDKSLTLEFDVKDPDSNKLSTVNIPIYEVGFTQKHLHDIEFNPDQKVPVYPLQNDGDGYWNPGDWLLKTVDNDHDKFRFLLMNIGCMLVPNHSFNCFWEINGDSNSGKTTLMNIVHHIYGMQNENVTMGNTLGDLQGPFPFRGTLTPDTTLVHITEINGANIRANDGTINLIDSFGNQSMMAKQMGKESISLTPPPLLVMEGKGWITFDATKTGISRRLMPIDISDAKTAGYYAAMGKSVFNQPDVISWFAKAALFAYAEYTQGDDNFMFELSDVRGALPRFAQQWHTNAINAGDENTRNFIERLSDALQGGLLPLKLVHQLYQQSCSMDGVETEYRKGLRNFSRAFILLLRDAGWRVEQLSRTNAHQEDELGLDFDVLGRALNVRSIKAVTNYRNSEYAQYDNQVNWIKISRPEGEL